MEELPTSSRSNWRGSYYANNGNKPSLGIPAQSTDRLSQPKKDNVKMVEKTIVSDAVTVQFNVEEAIVSDTVKATLNISKVINEETPFDLRATLWMIVETAWEISNVRRF